MKINYCQHIDDHKIYIWDSQIFSEQYSIEYQYYDCFVCHERVYNGNCRFVNAKNILTNLKEKTMNESNNKSVSSLLKSRCVKEGKGLSLKEFARRLVFAGDQVAINWFAHKNGSLNETRSEKNRLRSNAESIATRLAKKSKKGAKTTPKV